MAVARSFSLGKILKKYSVVIFFPTFTVTTIYADYSHTQKWKAQKALKENQLRIENDSEL